MALVPEFISILRDIRDVKYQQINTWFSSIFDMNSNIESINTNVEEIQVDVTKKNNSIKSISVLNPVKSVANQPNGSAGSANVIYNATTNQFDFYIPIGEKGESMRINGTVPLITGLYSLTVNTGDIYFVEENLSNYVKLDTGVNTGESDWSLAIQIIPAESFIELSDTPNAYTDQVGKVPVVSASESGLVFKTGAELGIIGYNYVKNPLFEDYVESAPFLTTVAFGSDKRGYGTFDTFVGTPTLASDGVNITNGVTIANTSVFTSGKSAIGVRVKLGALVANATIVNCGNFKLILNSNLKFAITNNTTTNSLTTLTPVTTDVYEIYATDQDLIVLNLTTGVMESSSMNLTIATQASGSIILGGDGLVAKFYAVLVQDKSDYVLENGVYEEFAKDWYKMSTGGEVAVIPDIEGHEKGMRFASGGLSTDTKVRMNVGDGGQFSGKEVTFSFTAYSSGVGANSVSVDFVTDRGSQIMASKLITQSVGTLVLDNGVEKDYSLTFNVDAIVDGTFLDSDAKDYFEFTLPASANFWIAVKKPKYEISSIKTDFTPQGGGQNLKLDETPTDGSANAVSSNGVFDALTLKAPLDSPAFTTGATIDGNNIATENYVASLGLSQMVLGTEVDVSGTAVDLTGIPSWAKRISIMFYLVSGSGTSDMIVQLGDSEGFETSGYVGDSYSSVHNLWSIGIVVNAPSVASGTMQGVIELLRVNTTKWIASGIIDGGASYNLKVAGVKELSGVLDRIRLTTVNGTDTFDAGSINIMYEG